MPQTHFCSLFPPRIKSYEIIEEENTVAHGEVVQGEQSDYGSAASDFSLLLLLLIASIVWKASCGKRSTHGYYTGTYYP